jgi:hypothetical protein
MDLGYGMPMENAKLPEEPMSISLILLIVCCVLCLSSSGTSYYLLSSESKKLASEGDTEALCKKSKLNVFPMNPDKYVCPYGRGGACSLFEEGEYNLLWCPFNYALVGDEPEGSRSKILNLMMTMKSSKSDVFNSQYFIERDFRKPANIYCDVSMQSCQDVMPDVNTDFKPNSNRFISIKSGDLIKLSSSEEIGKDGKPYTDYYAYIIYDLIVTFSIGVSLGKAGDAAEDNGENIPIKVTNLRELKKELANMEKYFRSNFTNTKTLCAGETPPYNFKCDKLEKKYREPKTTPEQNILQKYSLVCFFYRLTDLGSLVKLFQNTFVKEIDNEIWEQYLGEIKGKINGGTSITMFEFMMYLTLTNYLEDKNLKFIFYKKD